MLANRFFAVASPWQVKREFFVFFFTKKTFSEYNKKSSKYLENKLRDFESFRQNFSKFSCRSKRSGFITCSDMKLLECSFEVRNPASLNWFVSGIQLSIVSRKIARKTQGSTKKNALIISKYP